MQSTTFEPKALFLPSIQNPIAVSFDPIDRKVYWTDVTSKTLSRASLDGNDYQVIARDGIEGKFVFFPISQSRSGLALDRPCICINPFIFTCNFIDSMYRYSFQV